MNTYTSNSIVTNLMKQHSQEIQGATLETH